MSNDTNKATQLVPQNSSLAVAEPEVMTELQAQESGILPTFNRAEIDTQIATAKRYPRSITAFKRQVLEMATLDEETARSMFYSLPRGGKKIEGPSVRMAEVVGSAWGNMRYAARVIDVQERNVIAEGASFDMEKNVAVSIQVSRRITTKDGRRYDDDMITVTGNAACSIALRNAIFRVVPFALVKDIYEKAKECSLGKGTTMEQKRKNAVAAMMKLGATEPQVYAIVKRKGISDLTVEDLIELNGIYTAIQEGDTTLAEVLEETTGSTAGIKGPKKKEKEPASQPNLEGNHETQG